MGKKRVRTPELDLTQAPSDSDDTAYSPSPPRASTSAGRKRARSPPPHDQDKPLHARMADASPFLAPRSLLFGGKGVELRPTLRLDDELQDGLLPFTLIGGNGTGGAGQDDQLAKLDFATSALLLTTVVKEKRGRKPGPGKKKDKKGKKKMGADDSDEESEVSSSSSEESDSDGGEEDRVDLDTIMPWMAHRFATPHKTKPRDPDKPLPKKNTPAKNGSSTKKPAKPQTVRQFNFNGKTPLLVVHHEPFEHKLGTAALAHMPDVHLGVGATGGMHASFFAMVRRAPPAKRHHFRLAVCTASGEEGCWKKTENLIWVQDFPQLASPVKDPAANPTHTSFSRAFLAFLRSPQVGLASKAQYRAFLAAFSAFDFSTSADTQLVTSLAGNFSGADALVEAGGLDSLATAISALGPRTRGKLKVEYLTATTDCLPHTFLEQLYAAAQGVPPLEYRLQHSERALAANNEWNVASGADADKVVVVYPTADELVSAAGKSKEEQYHVRWDGRAWDELRTGDARKTVLRRAIMLIVHQPLKEERVDDGSEPEQYGRSSSTPASWGTYDLAPSSPTAPSVTVKQHELSVLYRCAAAPTWPELRDKIDEIVPYERPLKRYGEDDTPAPTAPPRPAQKRAGRPKAK